MFEKMLKSKKGYSIQEMLPLVIIFGVIVIAVSLMASVLTDVQGTQTANAADYNITGYGLTAMLTFGEWMPTLALIVIISVLVGVLIVYLAKRFL